MKAFIQNTIFGLFLCLPLLITGNLHAQTPTAENARERVTSAEQPATCVKGHTERRDFLPHSAIPALSRL